MNSRRISALAPLLAMIAGASSAALAQDASPEAEAGASYAGGHGHGAPPVPQATVPAPVSAAPTSYPAPHQAPSVDPEARAAWLSECRRRLSGRDRGWGGAAIGGVVGGIAGNRIAGKHNRTLGTVAGAAVGAAAGMAIDKAEDRGRIRDECETHLDEYYAYHARASQPYYAQYPMMMAQVAGANCCQHGAAMTGPMMMVPVMMVPRREAECTETVEYVEVPSRPRARRILDKRIRVVPDKRVRIN